MSLRDAARAIRLEAATTSKESSVLQNLNLYEMTLDGALGADAQDALTHTLQVQAAKEASSHKGVEDKNSDDSIDNLLSNGWQSGLDENSRKRRLAETLKKREATDTDGGSASPNPQGAV